MIFMRKYGGFVYMVVLLIVGLSLTPAMGSMYKADEKIETVIPNELDQIENYVTVEFFDYTGDVAVKKSIQLPESKWEYIRGQLKDINELSSSVEESWNAQLKILKEYDFISKDVTYDILNEKMIKKSRNIGFLNSLSKIGILPIINNSVFNAICGINFELTNGTILVFGLNTFLNIVGFDIISVHYGYSPEGIETRGLLSRSSSPGTFIGFMFGFLGYWLGTKTGVGIYTDLIANGFTVITVWLPIPSK